MDVGERLRGTISTGWSPEDEVSEEDSLGGDFSAWVEIFADSLVVQM